METPPVVFVVERANFARATRVVLALLSAALVAAGVMLSVHPDIFGVAVDTRLIVVSIFTSSSAFIASTTLRTTPRG